jgi:hypothetical protein
MTYLTDKTAVGFNSEWVAGKSLKEFLKHEKHQRLTEDQLKQVHAMCVKKHKPGVAEEK